MKDRVTRSNIKKPTHRLFRAMMVISVFTVVCTAFLSVVLFHVSNENKVLLNKIENYTVQIDEDNGAYRCVVTLNATPDTETRWSYTDCRYDVETGCGLTDGEDLLFV